MAAIDAPAPHAAPEQTVFVAPANLGARKSADRFFVFWGFLATTVGLLVLGALVFDLFVDANDKLNPNFFLSFPATDAKQAGILSAWVGSVFVIITVALIAIPIGVAAGLYLEEYAPKNAVTDFIEITVNNLAGVPSIVYGLLALGLFVYVFGKPENYPAFLGEDFAYAVSLYFGQTILTAGLTLALLILPIIIVATREAVRSVPRGIREAALSVGATSWQSTSHHVLPYATPGIVTGVIIGLSRALGETAPLIVIGVPTFVAFLPVLTPDQIGQETYDAMGNAAMITQGDVYGSWLPFGPTGWLSQSFTVMPMQMFNWTQRPEPEFQQNAAAAGIVLLFITLLMNGFAIWLRYNLRKKIRW
jgi:phosphate transport system permease protein